MDSTQALSNQKCIALETYKKNGEAKRTPVWFRLDNGLVYFHTGANTWKAKRLRKNPNIRLAPCTWGGKVQGDWLSGKATLVGAADNDDIKKMIKQINSRYGMIGRVIGATEKNRVLYSISLDP